MADDAPKTSILTRVGRAWRSLAPEGRMAAGAALLLFVTMFLPWYQQNVVVNGADRSGGLQSQNLSAFGVFSFVEAAVLLVAVAVLALLFARAERRSFHLPGGDGTVVTVAGGWVVLLLVWRLFDKPELQGAGIGNMGIQWGIFFALGAAGLLAWSGVRMRHADRPEPPVVGEAPRRRRRPHPPGTEVTRPLPPEGAAAPRPAPPAPPPPADAATDLLPDPPTRRIPDPPTRRIPDPPTRRMPDPPTERLPEPPTERLRLWDDR